MLNGFDEAIVLNEDGHVSEGSAENFFMVRDGKLITPPVSGEHPGRHHPPVDHRPGRGEFGMETVERQIDRTEVYVADEAFFCGTGVQIAAIGSVDQIRSATAASARSRAGMRELLLPRRARE